MADIKPILTEHIYYGKYLYKVELTPPGDRIKGVIYLGNIFKRMNQIYGDDWKHVEAYSYYYNTNAAKITFYLTDSGGYNYLRRNYKTEIVKLYAPMNEKHQKMLLDGTKILFRKKFFYNKYRLVIRFAFPYDYDSERRRTSPEWTKFEKVIKRYFKSQKRVLNVDYRINVLNSYWNNSQEVKIYIKDPKDAVMLRFKYDANIKKIESIVLDTELDSE